jgi:hypothetical protein
MISCSCKPDHHAYTVCLGLSSRGIMFGVDRSVSAAAPLVTQMRADGYSWHVIARALNRRGVPTPTGEGQWWPGSAARHFDAASRDAWRRYIATYRADRGR